MSDDNNTPAIYGDVEIIDVKEVFLMTEYINTEKFKEFLIDVLKPEYWWETEFDKWCESALDSYFNSGSPGIEVEQWYTKSRNPECYSFDVESIYDEEYDSYDYKVIF